MSSNWNKRWIRWSKSMETSCAGTLIADGSHRSRSWRSMAMIHCFQPWARICSGGAPFFNNSRSSPVDCANVGGGVKKR